MSIAVLVWQLFILITIAVSGKKRALIVTLWVIWTLVQLSVLWLSVLQFFSIYLGYVIAKKNSESSNVITKTVEEKQKAPFRNIDRLKVGKRVSHPNLGKGLIKEFDGIGVERRVHIIFDKHGSRWFYIPYTNALEII